jgi:uncharacterized OB-fold protein
MSDHPQRHDSATGGASAMPPSARSPSGLELTAAAARGRFELQACAECHAVQYPPREACHRCLSTELAWQPQPDGGELISETTLRRSQEEYFQERLPWRIGMVRLDCGPTAITHVLGTVPSAPCRVRIAARLDEAGQGVLVALPVAGETKQHE